MPATAWAAPTWSIAPSPNPASQQGVLSGLSCTSDRACTAVGHYSKGDAEMTLAEAWNGTKWTIEPTPNPTGALVSILSGVSCTSDRACTAVGHSINVINHPGFYVTLAEAWNGTRWAIQPTPNPTGATDSTLSGVSCTLATACTAVGSYDNSHGAGVTLAEVWNGTKWSAEPTPNPTGSYSFLSGVSCTSARACTAVGHGYNGTLAEAWNGTKWAIEPTPNPTGEQGSFSLNGVSCTSARACTAVGDYGNPNTLYDRTLAEAWNGTKWAIQSTPNPTGEQGSTLSGVSCTLATACSAVGYAYNFGAPAVTLAEAWNGTKWAIEATPSPSGAQSRSLSGVSCTSATACSAVGNYHNATGADVTLAEAWNGTKWAIEPTPNPTGA
ncbi:MAG: hypothetical protein ABSD78_04545, partial [Acidimicrobiales bacterium]